jgi:hypothetical protein
MLSEFVRLLSGRDRRVQPRRRARFPLWWFRGEKDPVAGQGLELSTSGLAFALPVSVPDKAMNLAFDLPSRRRIMARVELTNGGVSTSGDKTVFRYGAKFSGIASDDWDAVVRYVNEAPEPTNKAAEAITDMQSRDDDSYRLLPLAIQRKIVGMLVQIKRLAPEAEGKTPLLKLHYLGQTTRPNGMTTVRVSVHSRIRQGDETLSFDTPFAISEDGTVKRES